MKILMFAASLRRGSYNKKLIRIAARYIESLSTHEIELCEFNDFPMPMYDADLESEKGYPESVLNLAKKFSHADAIIISSPEYNGSIPGTFKNAIDWLSRISPDPIAKKQICLIGASPGNFGAARGNLHARVPFQVIGAYVYPEYFGLSRAHESFDEKDQLKDPKQYERLTKMLSEFLHYATRRETPFDKINSFFEERRLQELTK